MPDLREVPTATLVRIRANLLAGLDRVAEHVAAGTFHSIPAGRYSSPAQSGQLTLALLLRVDAELVDARRHAPEKL